MTTQLDNRPIARLADGKIELETFHTAATFSETLARCKAVPGAEWNPQRKVWTYPATPETAWQLRNAWREHGGFRGGPGIVELVQKGRELSERADTIQAIKSADDLPDLDHMKRSAWLHQRRAFHFAKELPAAGLFIGMGGGKTYITIALLDEWKAQTALIECPLSVVNAWAGVAGRPGQFAQHSKRDWIVVNLGEKAGTVAKKTALAKAAIEQGQTDGRPVALVINYESARLDPFAKWAATQQFDAAIFDESHRLKEPGGVTARHAQTIGRRAQRKLLLTGTPMPHNPTDIYSQYRAVAPHVFGTNFARFKNRYCKMGGYMNREIIGFQNEAELQQKIYSIAMRVTKEELDRDLSLPEYRHIYRTTHLSSEARGIYNELSERLVADLGEGKITAANALVRLLRLAQITSGFAPLDGSDDEERVWKRIDSAKAKLLQDVLEDLPEDEPVVIFARFTGDLDMIHEIAEKLGRGSRELSGRRKELEDWQNDTDDTRLVRFPILAVQEQAGGVGIDLTRARFQIFYSKGFSLGNYDQALARVHRPGQTRSVVHIHLECEGTVDQYVDELLAERRDVVEGILTLARSQRSLRA